MAGGEASLLASLKNSPEENKLIEELFFLLRIHL